MPASAIEYSGPFALAAGVVLFSTPDGSVRLLDLNGGAHALSASGAWLLERLLQREAGAVVREAASTFQLTEVAIATDVQNLLTSLQALRLVQPGKQVALPERNVSVAALSACLRAVVLLPAGLGLRAWVLLAAAAITLRICGWSTTTNAFRRAVRPGDLQASAAAIDAAVRAAAAIHPVRLQCKERGLTCWLLAGSAGLSATLVVGFRNYPIEGHCWCIAAGDVISDYADRCEVFTPVISYDFN